MERGLTQLSRGEGQRQGPAECEREAEIGSKGVHLRRGHEEESKGVNRQRRVLFSRETVDSRAAFLN